MTKRSPHRYDFNGFKIMNFEKIDGETGICIRCAKELNSLHGGFPLCDRCYSTWAQFNDNNYGERYCHWCRKSTETSKRKPFCLSCFRKYEKYIESKYTPAKEPITTTNKTSAENVGKSTIVPEISSEQNIVDAAKIKTEDTLRPEKPTQAKPSRRALIWITSLLCIGLVVGLLLSKKDDVSRSDVLRSVVRNYYVDLQKNPELIEKYFGNSVEKYILLENKTPKEIIKQIKKDSDEFMYGKSVIDQSTFHLDLDSLGRERTTFWMTFTCYRNSKDQFQKCRVHEELIFDENGLIVQVNELEVRDLEFSFQEIK